jgi:hypothetical protein
MQDYFLCATTATATINILFPRPRICYYTGNRLRKPRAQKELRILQIWSSWKSRSHGTGHRQTQLSPRHCNGYYTDNCLRKSRGQNQRMSRPRPDPGTGKKGIEPETILGGRPLGGAALPMPPPKMLSSNTVGSGSVWSLPPPPSLGSSLNTTSGSELSPISNQDSNTGPGKGSGPLITRGGSLH